MSMEGFSNLKDRRVSFRPKKEDPARVASFLSLLRQALSPAETRQASWELYPGKSDLIQATEVLKLILNKGKALIGQFLIYNSLQSGNSDY